MDDDCPPSYEDYMNEMRSTNMPVENNIQGSAQVNPPNHQKEYWTFLRIHFTAVDIGCSIVAFMGYLLFVLMMNFFEVKMLDVKQFCDHPEYHHENNEHVDYVFAFAIAGVVVFVICATTFLGFAWGCSEWRKMLAKTIRKIWVVAAGYFYVYMYVYILQIVFGIPTPYFFSNEQLYDHYCKDSHAKLDHELDKKLRMSFPSYLMAFEWFSSAFLVFYIDHFDVGLGPHIIQLVMIGSLAAKCSIDGIALYENHEHHLADVIVGALIGIATAAITVRNLKGTVLRNTAAMPKYITNGILLDSIERCFQNFCSMQFYWRPRRQNRHVTGYGFPDLAARYSFQDTSTSTEPEPRVPSDSEPESEGEPEREGEP